MKTKNIRKKLGIKSQVLIGFGIFTVIIVALLWIFQIAFLNTFYKIIKENEVVQTAQTISESLEDEYIEDILIDLATSTDMDILITEPDGTKLISVSQINSNFFEVMGNNVCSYMYNLTEESDGILMDTYDTTDDFFTSHNFVTWSFYGSNQSSSNQCIVASMVVTTESGYERLILLKSDIIPVSATVETLKVQLTFLTIFMVILAIILAFIIAKKISDPIVSINNSAKNLANGNYSEPFQEKGSSETVQLAKTLNYANHELSKVDNLRKELIANVSHDLRTPLTMIAGYSEVMRDIPGENSPENLQIIIDETHRLTNLVNDLLDISKLESGKLELTQSNFNLTESIRVILMRYEKFADYTFTFNFTQDIFVFGDELKLSQVVYNLVNNAMTHTGEDKKITITQTLDQGFVRIDVSDTGNGIPQDKIKDIWERYYKVDKEHKRGYQGTGLGLSIVKNILELHRGYYGVHSQEGIGTTFWFAIQAIM